MTHQRGGTFLGFVLGLVLGLAIALGVAVYVTKVPVPFLNKSQSRSAEQDAAEAKKNKDWDPNAPLYGKNPAKPGGSHEGDASSSTSTPSSAPSSAPSAAPSSAPVPAVAAPSSVSVPAVADPKSREADAKAKDPFNYFIQTGAFRTEDDAQVQRAKLALSGMDAKVSEREQAGRMVYRVRVGPYEKREDADKIKDKLETNGYDTVVVRVQK